MTNFGMRFRFNATQGPSQAPIFASVNLVDANATVPGFCTKVHALPLIAPVNLGMTDGSGEMYFKYRQIPYTAVAVGVAFYTQLFTADTNGRLLLTNGSRATMPTPNTNTGHRAAAYAWGSITGTPPTAPTRRTWIVGGSIVARLGL